VFRYRFTFEGREPSLLLFIDATKWFQFLLCVDNVSVLERSVIQSRCGDLCLLISFGLPFRGMALHRPGYPSKYHIPPVILPQYPFPNVFPNGGTSPQKSFLKHFFFFLFEPPCSYKILPGRHDLICIPSFSPPTNGRFLP